MLVEQAVLRFLALRAPRHVARAQQRVRGLVGGARWHGGLHHGGGAAVQAVHGAGVRRGHGLGLLRRGGCRLRRSLARPENSKISIHNVVVVINVSKIGVGHW